MSFAFPPVFFSIAEPFLVVVPSPPCRLSCAGRAVGRRCLLLPVVVVFPASNGAPSARHAGSGRKPAERLCPASERPTGHYSQQVRATPYEKT